ncbi:MAG: flagellar FliJ family protein [Rickettsiaceae bacterium]|nr:flagellar FliJ family protein [Rickettsiaceae bacterium]
MKTLTTLIKLHKNQLDKILRQIEHAESEKVRLELKKKAVEEEAETEVQKYSISQYAYMLERYLENSRKLLQRIDVQILQASLSIDKLRSVLRDQYSELKKFEIALENKKKLEVIKFKKTESKFTDEFNISKFIFDQKESISKNIKPKDKSY